MTLIRKLASALFLVLLFTSYSNAQQLDYTTGNIVQQTISGSGTTPWVNGVYQDNLTCWAWGNPGYCGPNAIVRPGNSINFSYGSTYLYQQQKVSNLVPTNALNIIGYQFGFTAKNGNGWDDGRVDQLTALVRFWDASGGRGSNNLLYGNSYNLNYKFNWTTFDYNQTLPTPLPVKSVGQVQYGFIGMDNNGWAGPYGPEVYNVSFRLKYSVDPCATNPAYSPNCAGFNTVSTSSNLVPDINGYAASGSSINQSYAINTALASAGSAAQIHGFQWGYVANANGPYCAFWLLTCWDERNPSVTTNVNITSASGTSLYSVTREYKDSYNTTNYSYLFPTSQTMSNLGNFNFTASTNDQAYVGNMWSKALYTADPCAVNPLSSPTCSGYAVAYAKLMASSSTTSSTTTVYTGTTSSTTTNQIETSMTGVEQTSPQTSSTTSTVSSSSTTTQDTTQTTTVVATTDPAQPVSTTPTPAGGPVQTTTASSSSTSSSSSSGSAGPSKLAMSVLKSAQEKDKATQNAAVASAAKTLENATQSSQASSNAAISMNQDMSANSAVAAANFASQTTQASQQTIVQSGQQQTTQSSSQTQQANRMGPQVQQQQQDSQQAQTQSTSIVQYQPPQQQETQQSQVQNSTSVVKLLPPQQQDTQQSQAQMTAGMIPPPQNTYTPPQQQQESQSTQVTMLKPPTSPVTESQQQSSTGTGITVGRSMFSFNTLTLSNNPPMSVTLPSQPMYQPRVDTRQFEVETPQMPIASFGGAGRAGNILSEIMMQQRFEMMQNNISQPTSSVNRNVQPNELASGVDIASIANVPAGFSAYSFVLKDANFYEPKEVYKNQKTVDNERVLRGLTRGSDSLHQQMVDSQYKLGE